MPEKKHYTGLTATLWDMNIGDTATMPLDKLNSIRATCSTCGLMWFRTYSTRINREHRTLTITRTK